MRKFASAYNILKEARYPTKLPLDQEISQKTGGFVTPDHPARDPDFRVI